MGPSFHSFNAPNFIMFRLLCCGCCDDEKEYTNVTFSIYYFEDGSKHRTGGEERNDPKISHMTVRL